MIASTVLAVLVYLRRAKALHLDQLPDAARACLGDGNQRGIGEHAVRGEFLVGRLLASPLPEHRHRLIVECRRAVKMPTDLAFGGLREGSAAGPAMQRER